MFDSAAAPLVFQDQYLRLRTSLPKNPNLYGLGEHTDPFKLNDTDYTRTMWSRDAYGIPYGTNLYGNHPICTFLKLCSVDMFLADLVLQTLTTELAAAPTASSF